MLCKVCGVKTYLIDNEYFDDAIVNTYECPKGHLTIVTKEEEEDYGKVLLSEM